MALFFRCVFLVALLGAAALGDKSAESAKAKRTNSRFDVLTRHRGDGKYPRIQPRSIVTPVPDSESNTSLGGPAAPPADGSENASTVSSGSASPSDMETEDCDCNGDEGEEKKKECESKCKNKEIKSASPSKSRSKSKSKSMERNEVSHPVPQKPEGQQQQEAQVNVQGEVKPGLENGNDNTGSQSPPAGSPANGSGTPETPNGKPGTTQEGSLSENRPGAEKEQQVPQKSDKQLDSTNNGDAAKDNADGTESNGDTSEKEKAENNNEARGGRDGQEKSIGSNEGRSGKDGSAETSSANLSGKTFTVLLFAVFARFGAW
ncbi:hypothetical protein TRVL_09284 [Trypanosoma vivax]|nr:hypothetical protein TRVL_09284 [Trypanosoma vivax]